jgi:hypothetical protein
MCPKLLCCLVGAIWWVPLYSNQTVCPSALDIFYIINSLNPCYNFHEFNYIIHAFELGEEHSESSTMSSQS